MYEFPFQAHAPLETMNCVADVHAGSCEVWVPTQRPRSCARPDRQLLRHSRKVRSRFMSPCSAEAFAGASLPITSPKPSKFPAQSASRFSFSGPAATICALDSSTPPTLNRFEAAWTQPASRWHGSSVLSVPISRCSVASAKRRRKIPSTIYERRQSLGIFRQSLQLPSPQGRLHSAQFAGSDRAMASGRISADGLRARIFP